MGREVRIVAGATGRRVKRRRMVEFGDWQSIVDAAYETGCHRRTIQRWAKAGLLEVRPKIKGHLLLHTVNVKKVMKLAESRCRKPKTKRKR